MPVLPVLPYNVWGCCGRKLEQNERVIWYVCSDYEHAHEIKFFLLQFCDECAYIIVTRVFPAAPLKIIDIYTNIRIIGV